MNKKIAIIMGEPKSINAEIIGKAWIKLNNKSKKELFLIGNYDLLKKQLKKNKIKISLELIKSFNTMKSSKKLKVFNVPLNKNYILKCIDLAHKAALNKSIKGFINCPIDKKKTFQNKKIGVTELLAKKNNSLGKEVMMIYNKDFSVVPITTHINVKDIAKSITTNRIINKIKTLDIFYKKILKKKPTIAILGLNPHNNELRKKSEERKIIIPAINKLKKNGIKVLGPFASDTIFLNKKKYKYDTIVGMYHDQVLGPFKALFGLRAINITLGLKYIRVSPDHGTASDIFCSNKGNPTSLLEAIKFFKKIKC
jgi:4-hydroxy-L-threonine phosphate dehydrogenase PdxA